MKNLTADLEGHEATPEPKTTITCPQCEGVPDMCNGYCEGTGTVTTTHAAEWHRQNRKPKAGKTLADFAGSMRGKAFKRPHHHFCFGFGSPYQGAFLKEFDFENPPHLSLPRLTAEDFMAEDWQEVFDYKMKCPACGSRKIKSLLVGYLCEECDFEERPIEAFQPGTATFKEAARLSREAEKEDGE